MLPLLVIVEDCWHGVLIGVTGIQEGVLSNGKQEPNGDQETGIDDWRRSRCCGSKYMFITLA